jgi:hypothetical protein
MTGIKTQCATCLEFVPHPAGFRKAACDDLQNTSSVTEEYRPVTTLKDADDRNKAKLMCVKRDRCYRCYNDLLLLEVALHEPMLQGALLTWHLQI